MFSKATEERFYAKVSPEPMSGCFLWTGAATLKGYGFMRIENQNQLATHMALYIYEKRGRPSKKHCACHTCDNPSCVNPAHLWWGTHEENMKDKSAKGRAQRLTKETKEKLIAASVAFHTGRKASAETRKKMSDSRYVWLMSEKNRMALAKANTGN